MNAIKVERIPAGDADQDPQLVWVLLGHRTGDNLQLQALADGLGWPWEAKSLLWPKRLPRWTPLYGRASSLKYLSPASRKDFGPPWPGLVLSVGWRSVPVARWVQKMSGAHLVHLGRPRAPLDYFDLVLTTPQYRLPQARNVVELAGPLTTLSSERLDAAAKQWAARLSHLPRPWFAVLIGGDTPTLRFPVSAAKALASACNTLAGTAKGSLLVATSPRTSQKVTDAFLSVLKAPSFCYQWDKNTDNPYAAFLALADQFIVTNDSISMTQEAALTGRPLHIFPLKLSKNRHQKALTSIDRRLRTKGTTVAKIYDGLIRAGLIYPPKSPSDYFERLIRSGSATLLGEPAAQATARPYQAENDRAVQAVRSLFLPDAFSRPEKPD